MDFEESVELVFNPPELVFHAPGPESSDVYIWTSSGGLNLHSRVLIMFSPWFAASMSTLWWKEQTPCPARGCRYSYTLDVDADGISTLLPSYQKEEKGYDPLAPDYEISANVN